MTNGTDAFVRRVLPGFTEFFHGRANGLFFLVLTKKIIKIKPPLCHRATHFTRCHSIRVGAFFFLKIKFSLTSRWRRGSLALRQLRRDVQDQLSHLSRWVFPALKCHICSFSFLQDNKYIYIYIYSFDPLMNLDKQLNDRLAYGICSLNYFSPTSGLPGFFLSWHHNVAYD